MQNHLLPEGFRDSLPEVAKEEFRFISEFVELMTNKKYRLVKPPLLEFEESMFFATKDNSSIKSFRVLDPLSQKVMAIRTDITTQIARIVSGSLKNAKRPLRVLYFGEILSVNNSQLKISRQSTQMGAEIIGTGGEEYEIEIIKIIIEILTKFKISDYRISLSMPTVLKSLSLDFNLDENQENYLYKCYENKNLQDIRNISTDIYNISEKLINKIGLIDEISEFLISENFPSKTQCEINKFIESLKNFLNKLPDVNFVVDTAEIDNSGYHTGMMFKFYSDKLNELFSGGVYRVNHEDCIGFSGLIENLIENK